MIWLGTFEIFQGVQNSIDKKPYIFVNFQGVGSGPSVPPLDPCMCHIILEIGLEFAKKHLCTVSVFDENKENNHLIKILFTNQLFLTFFPAIHDFYHLLTHLLT